jgi:PAS domain S-box-containing protein
MGHTVKVLIVDDEELIRLNLRAVLEDLGYRVVEAANGREGLDLFDSERPGLVLVDLMMPVMDGLSMIAALREKNPETPVIVISGAGTVREAVNSLRLGAWDYVMKPIPDAEGLDITIKRVLEKARLVRDNRLYREHLEKTAEELRISEERYALAVQGSNDGIWDLNILTGEAYYSARWNHIVGYEDNEITSNFKEWESRIHQDDYQRVMETNKAYGEGRIPLYEIEYRICHKDGGYRWVLSRGACLRDSHGNPYRMAGSLTDITDHKKLEQQLLQSQKMESIGILAGGVAHEFNNLLTAISGYGQFLQESIPPDDELSQESVGNVLKATERAAELTRSLLSYSRKLTMKPEPVRVDTIIVNVGKLIQRVIGEDIEISVNVSGEDLLVHADAVQMEQALMNLATNARDAMPRGGCLSISAGKVTVDEGSGARYDLAAPGTYALVSVADTGRGIDSESLEKIFEPFYSTKKVGEGTGLGLSIAYGIIKQHNGSITVSSEQGRGTIFTIYLPLIEGHGLEKESKTPAPHVAGTKTVLVAEDEAIVRSVMQRMLERAGYRVIVAEDGEEAVARFREHGDISLVLSDVIMPGKNGREMLHEIRKIKPGIKVVFISGYSADVMREKGILEEETDLITKPFKKDDLLRKVQEMLGRE